MSARAEAPKSTQLFGKLSPDQQAEFNKVVIDKLRTLIGGYGELSVLAEYIAVMLQSSRPQEQIQSELEAFLQDQSRPFTQWLCDKLSMFAGEDAAAQADASKGEALLMRAVRDARQGAEKGEEETTKRKERGERDRRASRVREKRSHAAAAPAAAAAAAPAERTAERASAAAVRHRSENHRSRSRQKEQKDRPRRRHRGDGENGTSSRKALKEVSNGNSVGSREPTERKASREETAERKAVLTPNVQFLRDAYHQKEKGDDQKPQGADTPDARAVPADTRWHFRADPAVPPVQASYEPPPVMGAAPHVPPVHPSMGPPPPMHHRPPYGPPGPGGPPGPPPADPSQMAPPASRPRHFPPKKWRVVRANTVVRATERLDGPEIQTLQDGEIVEQVAPAFKMKNGIIRIQIRHPSSPQFPNPIGWVTQDATAAGGPKFLEPGPEPMARAPAWVSPRPYRPRGPPGSLAGPPAPAGPPSSQPPPRGPYGFQNLTWKPTGAAAAAEKKAGVED